MFTPMGLVVFGTDTLYMVLVGRCLLPVREAAEERQARQLREYVSEVRVPPESSIAGRTLIESRLGADYDVTVIALVRQDRS